jgi:hypothetical protein
MKGAEESVQRMQEATRELNEAVRKTSRGQMDDWVNVTDRVTQTVAKAAQTREPAAFLTVQPELFSCFVDAAQTSNKRWLELFDQVRTCSIKAIAENGAKATTSQTPQSKGDGAGASEESPVTAE